MNYNTNELEKRNNLYIITATHIDFLNELR